MSSVIRNSLTGVAAGVLLLAMGFGPAMAQAAKPAAPPPLSALLEQAMSDVHLSASGRYLAYVQSDGQTDHLVVTDLEGGTSKVLFSTKPATKELADKDGRQAIIAVAWKGDDRLIVSIAIPETSMRSDQLINLQVMTLITTRDGTQSVALNQQPGTRQVALRGSAVVDILRDDPDHILVALREGDLVVYRVNVHDGKREEVERGGPLIASFGTNKKGEIVTRTRVAGHEGLFTTHYAIMESRVPGEKEWTQLFEIHPKEFRAFSDMAFESTTDDPKVFLVTAYPDAGVGDTRAVRTFNADDKTLGPIIFANPKYDASSPYLVHKTFAGGCYVVDVEVCEFKDKDIQADYDALSRVFKGERTFTISSFAYDMSRWVVHAEGPADPGSYYVFTRKTKALDELGSAAPSLEGSAMGHTSRFEYASRDGTPLTGYLTLPATTGAAPPPLVVLPHGGPELRDQLEYNVWVQYLASRGYAVLQPNFRGSAGFGRKFADAGRKQWGALMADDIDDALKAALAQGKVDPARVCIVGASYGGYAALAAAGLHPDRYKCAVSIDGLSDLIEDISWERRVNGEDSDAVRYWLRTMGDPSKDGAAMAAQSPVNMARDWKVPTLLIHGDADDTVYVEQSRKMNRALQHTGMVKYDEVKDMGHGPASRKEFTHVLTEIGDFLDQHIGAKAS